MSSRSPARWLAPLALVVAIAAVGYVVTSSTRDEDRGNESSQSPEREAGQTTTGSRTSPSRTTTGGSEPRTYTVRSGDTLGTIAERTGVSVAELQELNPDVDPQSLNVGDRIRLRR